MNEMQAKYAIAYSLGAKDRELEKECNRQEKEMLIDNFDEMIDDLYEDYIEYLNHNDGSELQILNDYMEYLSLSYVLSCVVEKYGI